MLKDYYKILGVASDASETEIREAYRLAAKQHHPDRGGSHEAMVLINEAWGILSDPQQRGAYDEARSEHGAQEADWLRQTEEVRKSAQQYPKDWAVFEQWLNNAAADLKKSKYQFSGFGWADLNSVSGIVCLIIGVILIAILYTVYGLHPSFESRNIWGYAMLYVVPGSLVGWVLHCFFELVVALLMCLELGQARKAPGSGRFETILCPACDQRLRVPALGKNLAVTCVSCQQKFDYHPS